MVGRSMNWLCDGLRRRRLVLNLRRREGFLQGEAVSQQGRQMGLRSQK